MKKIIACIFLMCIFYGRFTYVDVNRYRSLMKTVEIKGAVKHPDVYEVSKHATIKEIIEIAGGLKEESDTSALNMNQDVLNHAVIVVAKKQQQQLVSINSATLEELDSLPGVGKVVATRMIRYREEYGFQKLEDLKNVKGIGDKMYEKLKAYITL